MKILFTSSILIMGLLSSSEWFQYSHHTTSRPVIKKEVREKARPANKCILVLIVDCNSTVMSSNCGKNENRIE